MISDNDAAALNALGIDTRQPETAGAIPVAAVVEAVATAMWEHEGVPVVVVGRRGTGTLGTLASVHSPVVKARPDMWRPLYLSLAYPEPKPAK